MSSQYKVCPLFWNESGDCYRLRNQNALEKLLNDGWKISRVDTMSPTEFQSGTTVSATNVYILEKQNEEKQNEDTKKEQCVRIPPAWYGSTRGTRHERNMLPEKADGKNTVAISTGLL